MTTTQLFPCNNIQYLVLETSYISKLFNIYYELLEIDFNRMFEFIGLINDIKLDENNSNLKYLINIDEDDDEDDINSDDEEFFRYLKLDIENKKIENKNLLKIIDKKY